MYSQKKGGELGIGANTNEGLYVGVDEEGLVLTVGTGLIVGTGQLISEFIAF